MHVDGATCDGPRQPPCGPFHDDPGATSTMNRTFTNNYFHRPNQMYVSYLTSEAGFCASLSQRPANFLFLRYCAITMTLPAQPPSPHPSRHIRTAKAVPRDMSTDLGIRLEVPCQVGPTSVHRAFPVLARRGGGSLFAA